MTMNRRFSRALSVVLCILFPLNALASLGDDVTVSQAQKKVADRDFYGGGPWVGVCIWIIFGGYLACKAIWGSNTPGRTTPATQMSDSSEATH